MPPLAKLGFLVLDDNPNMVTIVRLVLKGFGAERIYDADTVPKALEIVRRRQVDIAFVDCNLGATDGIGFVRLIRTAADSPNIYLPMVMLSAYSEESRVMNTRDAGATDFLVKPITATEVYRKIMDVVDHPRPFVRSADFFGPDRRRKAEPFEGQDRRVAATACDAADTPDVVQ